MYNLEEKNSQVSRKLTRGASDRLLSIQSVSIGSDGVRLPTFSTPFTTLLCSLSLSRTDTRRIDEFCHGNPSPSDPMESVCRHFPAPPQELYFAVYLLSLSQTDSRPVRWILASATVSIRSDGVRLPTFPPPPQELYFAVYLLSLAQLARGQSDGLLPRQTVTIGSDGVRLPTCLPPRPQLYTLLYIHQVPR